MKAREDDGVQVGAVRKSIDEVARVPERHVSTGKTGEVHPLRSALLVGSDDDLVLVRVTSPAEEKADTKGAIVHGKCR